jgi:hypothetical protein
VISAVIIFVVEAIGRRANGRRAKIVSPVTGSIRIASGARIAWAAAARELLVAAAFAAFAALGAVAIAARAASAASRPAARVSAAGCAGRRAAGRR